MKSSLVKSNFYAYAASSAGEKLKKTPFPFPSLGAEEVLVDVSHCGVCRSDLHFLKNSWGDAKFPLIPGHEVVGVVSELGEDVSQFQVGQRVAVSWQLSACGHCRFCEAAREEFCPDIQAVGIGRAGGFADKLLVDARFVYAIPESISSLHAGPLMCAGSTVFNAFYRFNVKPGMKVGILGIGGLGHLAIQFAVAFGCEVTAFVNDLSLADEIRAMGASYVFSSQAVSAQEKVGVFDFLLSTIDEDIDYQAYIDLLEPLGTFCFAGIPPKEIAISVFSLIIGQKVIGAVPVGNRNSIKLMLEFAAKHSIKPYVEVMPMASANEALNRLALGQAHYRIVLTNESKDNEVL